MKIWSGPRTFELPRIPPVPGRGGHAWQGVGRGKGGMCGGGGWAVCMAGDVHTTHNPNTIRYGRSMRGRYTSYWNAFLLVFFVLLKQTYENELPVTLVLIQYITSNRRQIWRPNQPMSLIVASIVWGVNEQNNIVTNSGYVIRQPEGWWLLSNECLTNLNLYFKCISNLFPFEVTLNC